MRQLNEIVRRAVGYNENRGDEISLVNVPFALPSELGVAVSKGWLDYVKEYGRPVLNFALAALFLLMVVRPLIKFLLARARPAEAPMMKADPCARRPSARNCPWVPRERELPGRRHGSHHRSSAGDHPRRDTGLGQRRPGKGHLGPKGLDSRNRLSLKEKINAPVPQDKVYRVQKAAIVLTALGEQFSADVFKQLTEEEIRRWASP